MPSLSKRFFLIVAAGVLTASALPAADLVTVAPGRVIVQAADATGAAILDARVSARTAGGHVQKAVAGTPGTYELSLPAGHYRITIEKKLFAPQTTETDVAAGQTLTLPLTLAPRAMTEQVTVNGFERPIAMSTRSALPMRDVPQTVDIIGQATLRTQAALSLQDVVSNVAGVTSQTGEGRRDQVAIRGFSAVNDVYVDGIRDDARYYRDLSNIEQVEVVKGPAAALFGRGSSGGLVNRVTKQPMFGTPRTEVTAIAGSFDRRRGSADVARPAGERVAFRITGAYEDTGSHRPFYFLERKAVAPALSWRATGGSELTLQAEILKDRRLPDRGIPSWRGEPLAAARDNTYGYPEDDVLENRVASETLTWRGQAGAKVAVRTVLRHTDYDTDFSNTPPGAVSAREGRLVAARTQYNASVDQRNLFSQTDVMFGAGLGRLRQDVLVGLELGRQAISTRRFNGTAASVDALDPVLTRPAYAAQAATDNAFTGSVFALYAQDQLSIGRWRALLGLRWDVFDQDLDDRTKADNDLSRLDRQWSPRAGLVYKLTERHSLYASVSRSFQPSGDGLSLAANAEELKPEHTTNTEMGAKADLLGGRASVTASVFRLERNNVKTPDPNETARLILVGKQRSDGIEISAAGRLFERLQVRGAWSWLDPQILRANDVTGGVRIEGNEIGNVSRRTGHLWADWSSRRVSVGGGVFHQDAWFASNDNLVEVPGYTRVDGRAAYRMGRYELALNVRNLLDRDYYESAHGNNAIMPAAGRNALVSLRAQW